MEPLRLTFDPVPFEERHGLVRYPVPLPGVRLAVLLLPPDLTLDDVARLIATIDGVILATPRPAPAEPVDRPWILELDPDPAP